MKIIAIFWKRGCSRIIGRKLEPVELRHADVHQDDRDLVLEQMLQRFLTGGRLDEVFAELAKDDLIGQQLRGLVVDQQDVDLFVPGLMSVVRR